MSRIRKGRLPIVYRPRRWEGRDSQRWASGFDSCCSAAGDDVCGGMAAAAYMEDPPKCGMGVRLLVLPPHSYSHRSVEANRNVWVNGGEAYGCTNEGERSVRLFGGLKG